MTLHRREERGLEAVEALTALLLRQRAEGPLAGLYDAGDIQWWWKDEASLHAVRTWLWSDDTGADVAWARAAEKGAPDAADGRIDADAGWLATARDQALTDVVAALGVLPARSTRPVWTVSDERDEELSDRLATIGFVRAPDNDFVQMWQQPATPPAAASLPTGFRFDDDRSRPPGRPHYLARRNGRDVAERLREVSLYRPDLDLCLRDADGTVAAYCLCWLDAANGVGLFEPVRTEDAYQRRGLGQALMAEGIRRLMDRGARTVRVTREADNPASAALYRRSGFTDAFRNLAWRRTS